MVIGSSPIAHQLPNELSSNVIKVECLVIGCSTLGTIIHNKKQHERQGILKIKVLVKNHGISQKKN
jgi:hypothetical protein